MVSWTDRPSIEAPCRGPERAFQDEVDRLVAWVNDSSEPFASVHIASEFRRQVGSHLRGDRCWEVGQLRGGRKVAVSQGGQRLAAPATLSRSDAGGTELAEVSEICPYRAPLDS